MDPADTLRFARAARTLSLEARRLGLRPPSFRCPPRLAGVDRSLRRRAGGSVVVAVRIRGRAWAPVLSDLVEGVVAANGLTGVQADEARRALWIAAGESPHGSSALVA